MTFEVFFIRLLGRGVNTCFVLPFDTDMWWISPADQSWTFRHGTNSKANSCHHHSYRLTVVDSRHLELATDC